MTNRKLNLFNYHRTRKQISEEDEQVRRAQRDRRHFSVLYDRHYEAIYWYVFNRVEDETLADDLVSQVFTKALHHLPRYQFRGVPFVSWLYRIAKNELNQWFRTQKSQRVVSLEKVQLQHLTEEWEAEYPEQAVEAMLAAIRQLKLAEIELIEMRFFEQRPFKEIAEILEITENNAKVRTYRVVEKLRKKLVPGKEGAL
ncbi:MAG: RNA polymerase sigma factor [Salibacteraceae bacterium]